MNRWLQYMNTIHSRIPRRISDDTMHYTRTKLYLKEHDDAVRCFQNVIYLKKNKNPIGLGCSL